MGTKINPYDNVHTPKATTETRFCTKEGEMRMFKQQSDDTWVCSCCGNISDYSLAVTEE